MDYISFYLKVDSSTNAFSYITGLGRNFKIKIFYFKSLENSENISYFFTSNPNSSIDIYIDCQSFVDYFASISFIHAKFDNS